jgi:septal ring factor EnvC (AmiA/AmiB activator)
LGDIFTTGSNDARESADVLQQRLNPQSLRLDHPRTCKAAPFRLSRRWHLCQPARKVEDQQATIREMKSAIAQQQQEIIALTANLKEQSAAIQKVSAQMAAAPHLLVTN